jgi:BirA family biotin operon repressor/biotin-[acetyl-CoA-carboxylase] ligase
LTTSPDPFHLIRLGRCRSTSDHIKENFARLERDLPLMVSADSQSGGRGREGRGWSSAPGLGLYATFAFRLADARGLPILSIASGVAVADMLNTWTGREFTLKWPNDILAGGKKIAGILCENMVKGETITCLVGIGINVNQEPEDFPPELRQRAGSLRQLTGAAWPVDAGLHRLAAAMAACLEELSLARSEEILGRARQLSRSYLKREISFHHQGHLIRGIFCGLAADGGLLLKGADGEEKVFYSGEIVDPARFRP